MTDKIQEILDKVDIEGFYREHLEKIIRETSEEIIAICPFHKEKIGSFSANKRNGLFHCFGCGAEGSVFQFIQQLKGVDFKEAFRIVADFSGSKIKLNNSEIPQHRPLLDPKLPAKYLDNLLKAKDTLAFLQKRRGYTLDTIKKYKIGWDGSRYTFPIYDEHGILRNIRRYHAKKANKMISYGTKKYTYGEGRIYGLDEMLKRKNETIHLHEGEPDKLLASQHKFLAVSGTVGAQTWKPEWTEYFRGRDVVLFYDMDPQGREGAEKACRSLTGVAKTVKNAELPVKGTKQEKDYTDYFLKKGGTIEKIKELVKTTPIFVAPAVETKKKKSKKKKSKGGVDEVKEKVLTLISSNLVHLVNDEGRIKYLLLREGKLEIEDFVPVRREVYSPKKNKYILQQTNYHPRQFVPYQLPSPEIVKEDRDIDNKSLLDEIISFLKDYLEMPSETDFLLLALWIFHSHLIEKFDVTPFLYFYGVFETGKTKAGEVLGELGFRCERVTAPTEATLFRAAHYLKTAVLIDEIKLWGPEGNVEVARLIRARYKRGLYVPRCNLLKPGEEALEYFDVFGPTIICTDEGCPESLKSRSITFIMTMNIKQKVEQEIDKEWAGRLRNKLTIFRANYLEKELEKQEPIARRRLNEIMMPLYQSLMLVDKERKEEFKMIVEGLQTSKGEEQKETLEADIIKEVYDYYLETRDPLILTKDLTEKINEDRPENRKFSPITIGMKMKRLGFRQGREEQIKGKKGSKGWTIDDNLLKKLMAQFDIEIKETEEAKEAKEKKDLFGSHGEKAEW